MLSGIGMEQLRKGELPRSSLLIPSLAFVTGFSVVFISLVPQLLLLAVSLRKIGIP